MLYNITSNCTSFTSNIIQPTGNIVRNTIRNISYTDNKQLIGKETHCLCQFLEQIAFAAKPKNYT